jgi:hypothetical protein
MRATSLLTASAAMLLSVSALAQQTPPSAGGVPTSHPATGVATAPRAPAPNPLLQADVSKIEGVSVIGADGKEIGDISTVLMRPKERKIDRLVIHVGGVLGIGGRYVAVPVDAFSWDGNRRAFAILKTANDITYMADWKAQTEPAVETGSSQPSGHAPLPPDNAGK